ncbi:MAG: hypothetical protein H8D94_00755 [Candidatus Pelagibacter sp.]|nr:hypothetical protein [Candidatus Pelagibacter sp.]
MKMHNLNPEDFVMDEIVSIELVGDEDTIDITVEDTHMFFANDVYSHNSALDEDVIEAQKISESYQKIMTADFVISLSRKVEDKIGNTGRFHVIKNRFGPDGLTYPAKVNTNTGAVEIYEGDSVGGKETQTKIDNRDNLMKKMLSSKYEDLMGSN